MRILKIITKVVEHIIQVEKKKKLQDDIDTLKTSIEKLDSFIGYLREEALSVKSQITSLSGKIEKDEVEYLKYKEKDTGNILDEPIEKLEAMRNSYTSKIGGKLESLKDFLEDFIKNKENKLKAIREYNIDEAIYSNTVYSDYEFNGLKEKINGDIDKISEINNLKLQVNLKIAEKNSDLKHILKYIKDACRCDVPKSKNEITNYDFEERKRELKGLIKKGENDIELIKNEVSNLNKVKYKLEDFKSFVQKVLLTKEIEQEIGVFVNELIYRYKELQNRESTLKNDLASLYTIIENNYINEAEIFKNLFKIILVDNRKFDSKHALNAFNRIYLQMDRKIEQHSIDFEKLQSMEQCIIDTTIGYLKNVYDEMNNIDKNSTIEIDQIRRKMLNITQPEKEKFEIYPLKEYLRSTIESCVGLLKQGKNPENFLSVRD